MGTPIKLVQGDNRPYITLTLLDESSGAPLNLYGSNVSVRIHFRSVETAEILTTIETTKVSSGYGGQVSFNFPGATLEVKPGSYLGDIEINFAGEIQTVYEPLEFFVRSRFATSVE